MSAPEEHELLIVSSVALPLTFGDEIDRNWVPNVRGATLANPASQSVARCVGMQALLLFLLYGGVLWLALMGLGYLRPKWLDSPVEAYPSDVSPRSPHAILDAGMAAGGLEPDSFPFEARERLCTGAMAIAARKPHLLFAIGYVTARLKPVAPDEIDAAIAATVESVEGAALAPGADRIGAWHPVRVRAFLESLPGEQRSFFYLPQGWNAPWHVLAYANARGRRSPRADDLSLALVALSPGAFDAAKPRHASDHAGSVDVIIEGREHAVDRIVLRVEGGAEAAVQLRDNLATVAAGLAGGLFGEALSDGALFGIRRGHDARHELAFGTMTYVHRIDRPYRTEGDRCLATVTLERSAENV